MLLILGLTDTARAGPRILLGDYDAEPRIGTHVDTERLLKRLNELGANTYMWLLWHSPNDWADLKVFLPKAQKAGISVWVYLAPYTETPEQDRRYMYSEPYRLDYIKWAQEIAKLSLQYPNLTGYVIDDFWRNIIPDQEVISPERFTADYIKKMVSAGKSVNPKIKFFPLIYFYQFNQQFANTLGTIIDGVVAAYPRDKQAVERALSVLDDRLPGSVTVIFPPAQHSKIGEHGFVYQDAHVDGTRPVQLTLHYDAGYSGPTKGYHQLQVRVDDQVIWDLDPADRSDDTVTIDLERAVRGKKTFKLSIGVDDVQGVGNFPLKVSFSDLDVRGINLQESDLGQASSWQQDVSGGFSVEYVKQQAKGRFRLPMIVMPAGSIYADKVLQHSAGTSQSISSSVEMLVDMAKARRIEGVVTYCLDKRDQSETFDAVQKIYKSATASQ